MGRKGSAGGSAGGSRYGKRGNVSFNKVVPKFIRAMQEERVRKEKELEKQKMVDGKKKVEEIRRKLDETHEETVENLEKEGFQVIAETIKPKDEDKQEASIKVKKRKLGVKERKITKQRTAKVGQSFNVRNTQRLSFARGDEDDEDDDDDDD